MSFYLICQALYFLSKYLHISSGDRRYNLIILKVIISVNCLNFVILSIIKVIIRDTPAISISNYTRIQSG